MPSVIVAPIAPYASIEAALADEQNIDWLHDERRAAAITAAQAATELREHLNSLGIPTEVVSDVEHAIGDYWLLDVPGDGINDDWLPPAVAAWDASAADDQAYFIEPDQGNVIIAGASRIGMLYGSYKALEELGFAWHEPDKTLVPQQGPDAIVTWQRILETPESRWRGFWTPMADSLPESYVRWLGRNRFNLTGSVSDYLRHKWGLRQWGGDHDLIRDAFVRPGLFEQHPEWFGMFDGRRQRILATGNYFMPSFANSEALDYFAEELLNRLTTGDLADIDILNVWFSDTSHNFFDQSPEAHALGNESDNLLNLYAGLAERFRVARGAGELNRPVTVAGISYLLSWMPPTNRPIIERLAQEDYLHVFYTNERSFDGPIDGNLDDHSANRVIVESLRQWTAIAPEFRYGHVDYFNKRLFAGAPPDDISNLAANYELFSSGRQLDLVAFMHPPQHHYGNLRLTQQLMGQLAWRDLLGDRSATLSDRAGAITDRYIAQRYGDFAADWKTIALQVSDALRNAQQMFSSKSLWMCLFQTQLWSRPRYTHAEIITFLSLYWDGGRQELPARFAPHLPSVETFTGLRESLALLADAERRWDEVLAGTVPPDIRERLDEDVLSFRTVASKYRLIAATSDYYQARFGGGDSAEAQGRMELELNYLAASPMLVDNMFGMEARSVLTHYRLLLGQRFVVRGRVRDGEGLGISGVEVAGLPTATVTDANGYFETLVTPGASLTIALSHDGYLVTPGTVSVREVAENLDLEFAARDVLHLYGYVRTADGRGVSGVQLDGFPQPVSTNDAGRYDVHVPVGWSGLVTAEKSGMEINSWQFESQRNDGKQNFRAWELVTVYGYARDQDGQSLAGVEIAGFPQSVTTNEYGRYTAQVRAGWSGTVRLMAPGYAAASVRLESVIVDTKQNLRGASTVVVYGYVRTSEGQGVEGVVIDGFPEAVITDAQGRYGTSVSTSFRGRLAPRKDGFTISTFTVETLNLLNKLNFRARPE